MKKSKRTHRVRDPAQSELARLRQREERLRSENAQLIEDRQVLEESRDRLATVLEVAPLACLTLDAKGIIRSANAAARALLRRKGNHLAGLPLTAAVADEDRQTLRQHIANCRRTTETLSCEVHLHVHLRDEDRPTPIRVSSCRFPGDADLLATTLIDITDREQAAEERRRLAQSEREARAASEAKNKFIAMLSHELRTPLTPVLAALSALVKRPDLPPGLKNVCAMMVRNIEAETRLIDDLLDATRIAHGKMQVERSAIDVHELVEEALELAAPHARDKRLAVTADLSAASAWVTGDPDRLRQVFANILFNAVKFTPAGGRIDVRSWNRGSWLAVEISDSGEGIPAPVLSRLFVPFEQASEPSMRSRGGLGLGLAICRGIVELHGGNIVAASPGKDQGSRFVIDLPTRDQPTHVVPIVPPRPVVTERPRILLVEDDDDTAQTIAELLRGLGYKVRIAGSVRAALETDIDAVDVLLSDIGLPDGSGLDLMRRLRPRGQLKSIVLSGYGSASDVRASKEAGFQAHLLKPVTIERLVDAIDQLSH